MKERNETMAIKIEQCRHCIRDADECDAFPCADIIDQREALATPYYDGNGEWQTVYNPDQRQSRRMSQ
jgi:hypothetical protein